MVIEMEALVRFSDCQLAAALDKALDDNDSQMIRAVVAEMDRRGAMLEV
jgi:hypothetical protein